MRRHIVKILVRLQGEGPGGGLIDVEISDTTRKTWFMITQLTVWGYLI